MSSAKNAFFPPPLLQHEGHFSFLKRKPFTGPDSEIRGKSSQTVLKNDQSLSSLFTSVLEKKTFYTWTPALYQHCKVKMTFASLDEISTRMAKSIGRILKQSKATPNSDGDTVIGFILDEVDSPTEKVIGLIFAILKLGATFMPLSPSIHPNDLSFAMNLVKPVMVVTPGSRRSNLTSPSLSPEIAGTLENLRANGTQKMASSSPSGPAFSTMAFDDVWNSCSISNVSLDEENLSLSYLQDMMTHDLEDWSDVPSAERTVGIYFTAGSVSTPHAVRIGTGEILNRIHWQSKIFPTLPSDAFALCSPLTDPRSLVQMLTPILAGKPLHLLSKADTSSPAALVDRIAEVKLTRLTLTPPAFEALVEHISANPDSARAKVASITHWFVSGGALKVEIGRKFFSLFSGVYKSGVFLVSMYGMIETGGEATFEVFFNAEDLERKLSPLLGTLSVGSPITNSSIAIVDRFDKLVPLGGRGEVVISGGCLSTGGYVSGGHGHGRGSGKNGDSAQNKKKSMAELRKQHILFRTGDIGRIMHDQSTGPINAAGSGVKRLYIEDRFDNETIQTGGEAINLKEWVGEVMFTKLVLDAAVITYHRGRDVQVTVAAVVLKPSATCIQVLEKVHERTSNRRMQNGKAAAASPLAKASLPTVFAVEEIPHLPNGRVDKKTIRTLFRKILLECDETEWQTLNLAQEDRGRVKFLCKSIALSTGLPLALVIRRFGKSFADLGGTPLNAVIVLKMCHDNGYPIKMKDFISAKSIGELAEVMKRSKIIQIQSLDVGGGGGVAEANNENQNKQATVNPIPGNFLRNDFDGKFTFEAMSMDDVAKVILFLKSDCPNHVQSHPQDIIKYWKGVVESVRPLGMSIVAKFNRTIVGLALTGDTHLKTTSKPPKDIMYGLELLESCLTVSKYQMWRNSAGRVARTHFLGVSSSHSNISPGERAVLIQELLERSCRLAKICHYSSLVISTANPIIQETGIHLLKFQPLLEFPASRFKSRDGNRPFAYADDNHTASVLIKRISGGGQSMMEEDERDSILSINTSRTNSDKFPERRVTWAQSGSLSEPSTTGEGSSVGSESISGSGSGHTTTTTSSELNGKSDDMHNNDQQQEDGEVNKSKGGLAVK